MKKNFSKINIYYLTIIIILLIGIFYKLSLTRDGNFIFNMDNARDFVDVREIIVLHKLRLTGPTSAIEGVYNGPAWYYLLAMPLIISGGTPFSAIAMMIVLWVIGGYFLMLLAKRWGYLSMVLVSLIWLSSNYIGLAVSYSFNPHAVTLLMPLFLFLFEKYLITKKIFYSILSFLLAGLFFNFEMNFGIFMPLVIIFSILFTKEVKLFKDKSFWFGATIFIFTLLPQIFFDLRHEFIMTKSFFHFLLDGNNSTLNILNSLNKIALDFYNVLVATFMNQNILVKGLLIGLIVSLIVYKKSFLKKDFLLIISLVTIFIPFLGYVFLPVTVNSWHLGGIVSASILLSGSIIYQLLKYNLYIKTVACILIGLIIYFSLSNLSDYFKPKLPSQDPSVYSNEITAIDYVYQQSGGKNFKAYVYLPSVIDYPYQYLFWWYGLKKYGYIPLDYSYLPNQPLYISNKDKFTNKTNFENSKLVFLIKEPDRIGLRHLWQNYFANLQTISNIKLGPLEVETKKEF